MTRDACDGFDCEHPLSGNALRLVNPVGHGVLSNAEFRGKRNLAANGDDRFLQSWYSGHGYRYTNESDNAASTQSDIDSKQTA